MSKRTVHPDGSIWFDNFVFTAETADGQAVMLANAGNRLSTSEKEWGDGPLTGPDAKHLVTTVGEGESAQKIKLLATGTYGKKREGTPDAAVVQVNAATTEVAPAGEPMAVPA